MSQHDREFGLRFYAYHASKAERWDLLFRAIEEQRLLPRQVDVFGSFEQPSSDLEQFALPAALAAGDAARFLAYAGVAANLRGLAEALARDEILPALAARGRTALATGLAAQLTDPAERARARAALAAAAGAPDGEWMRELLHELRDLPPFHGDAEAGHRADALAAVARAVGEERAVQDAWPALTRPFDGPLRDRLWLALADACRGPAGELIHPGVQSALSEVADTGALAAALAPWCAEARLDDPATLRALLTGVADPKGHVLWAVLLPALGRQADRDPAAAVTAWHRERECGPAIPWTVELIAAGATLWTALDPAATGALAAGWSDPELAAALHVVRLETMAKERGGRPVERGARDEIPAETARAAADALTGPSRLHWSLRAAAAWPDAGERAGLATSLAQSLAQRRYAAPAGDLCRLIDLAARDLPWRHVQRLIEDVLWAPESGPGTLETLAAEAGQTSVLAHLLERAPDYAALVGPTDAEAFELRCRVVIHLAGRLCLAAQSLAPLDRAARHLLPDEQEQLREEVARRLAAAGEPVLAAQAAEGLRGERRKLAVLLAVAPLGEKRDGAASGGEDILAPARLYRAVADVTAAEDELRALAPLLQLPFDAEALFERHLRPIADRARQGQALVDLAHHAVAFETRTYDARQRDPLGPLQLVRHALTAVGKDERLLDLAVELLELAAPLPAGRAFPEAHEALSTAALRFPEVPWARRREALETLLVRLEPVLLGDLGTVASAEAARRCARMAGLIEAAADLADRAEESPARDDLRAHWHEVLPVLVAAAERMPGAVVDALVFPFWAWFCDRFLNPVHRLLGRERGRERVWHAIGRIGAKLPERLRRGTRWLSGEPADFVHDWKPAPAAAGAVHLCCLAPDSRRAAAEALLADPAPPPAEEVRALAFLLAGSAAGLVCELVGRLPPGEERDGLCLALLRGGWIAGAEAGVLAGRIGDEEARREADLARGPEAMGDETWVAALGFLLERGSFDPADPRRWRTLRRLWTLGPAAAPALAAATGRALARGRTVGERALRVWLQAHLAPRLGEAQPEALCRLEELKRAVHAAATLPGTGGAGTTAAPKTAAAGEAAAAVGTGERS